MTSALSSMSRPGRRARDGFHGAQRWLWLRVCLRSSPISTGPGFGFRKPFKVGGGRGFSRVGTDGGCPSPHREGSWPPCVPPRLRALGQVLYPPRASGFECVEWGRACGTHVTGQPGGHKMPATHSTGVPPRTTGHYHRGSPQESDSCVQKSSARPCTDVAASVSQALPQPPHVAG